jgi:hypothetical protein
MEQFHHTRAMAEEGWLRDIDLRPTGGALRPELAKHFPPTESNGQEYLI